MLIEEKGVCRCRSKRAGRTPTASTGISAISTTTRMSNKPLVISSASRDGCGEIPKWRDSSTRYGAITTRFRRVGRTGFYGLDLYSLHASMKAVEDFLERVGPTAAERARTRTPAFGPEPQIYGWSRLRTRTDRAAITSSPNSSRCISGPSSKPAAMAVSQKTSSSLLSRMRDGEKRRKLSETFPFGSDRADWNRCRRSGEPASIAFSGDELGTLGALHTQYSGRTPRQQNPHPWRNLARAAWLIDNRTKPPLLPGGCL